MKKTHKKINRRSRRKSPRPKRSSVDLQMQIEVKGKRSSFESHNEERALNYTKRLAKKYAARSEREYFSDEQVDFEIEKKNRLTENLGPEASLLFSKALTGVIPSKTSPEPAITIVYDGTEVDSPARNTDVFFATAYQASNFIINGEQRFAWTDSIDPPTFMHNVARGTKDEKNIQHLSDDAIKTEEYNCSNLLSKEDCRKIFRGRTADQLAFDISVLVDFWVDGEDPYADPEDTMYKMLGGDALPKAYKDSAGHYALAIDAGISRARLRFHEKRPACGLSRNFLLYIEAMVIKQKDIKTEKQALDYLLSNADLFDDLLWNEDALDMFCRRKQCGSHFRPEQVDDVPLWVPSEKELIKMKETQRMVLEFTNLMDLRWEEKYESEGKSALRERFGHPVGIPSQAVREHHFLPGGYLVESGWLEVTPGSADKYKINFPVDKNGKPRPSTKEWENVSPKATINRSASKLKQLSTLSQHCVRAAEAWHISYNKGLPRDSLYTAAQISVIDPAINGNSYDDVSGTVRGCNVPLLRGIEFAVGKNMRHLPTLKSKISAISRKLADERTCPSGMMSLEEIDLSNWRLHRFSDMQCGNEYGHQELKDPEGAKLVSFDQMGREFHEKIQKKIRNLDESDGLFTFYQPEHDFVRPLAGVQRAEAVSLYLERPGTYLRRSGSGGFGIVGGCSAAFLHQISQPMAPWSAFLDVAVGRHTDGSDVAWGAPGRGLTPHNYCAKGSGILNVGKFIMLDDFSKTFPKFMSVASMRRGENFPRRLRFAMRSLGETASVNGLIYPEANLETVFREANENIHTHIDDVAYFSDETFNTSKKLENAHWNDQCLFALDFELGEMGTLYRQAFDDEIERRIVLQRMLAGKHTFRHSITNSGRLQLQQGQRNYVLPADPRIAFGDLDLTGGTWVNSKPINYLTAKGHGVTLHTVMDGWGYRTFINSPAKYRKLHPLGVYPGMRFVQLGILYASRSGYTLTGLESTPLMLDGSPPLKQHKHLDEWCNLVFEKALDDTYEVMEMEGEGIRKKVGQFKLRYEKRLELDKERGIDSQWTKRKMAITFFEGDYRYYLLNEAELAIRAQAIYFDELVERALRNEGGVRPSLAKFHKKHFKETSSFYREGYGEFLLTWSKEINAARDRGELWKLADESDKDKIGIEQCTHFTGLAIGLRPPGGRT